MMQAISRFFIFIILLSAIGHVAADLYLPSFPAIMYEFSIDADTMQFTVSIFMYGLALSQLIYGPVSDAFGRRGPLLAGLAICLVGTILCASASSIQTFYIGRFLQGIGVGSGSVLSRIILRDRLSGNILLQYLSYLSISSVAIMVMAPLLGGYIQTFFDWQANFIFLLVYIILLLVTTLFWIPETHADPQQHHIYPKKLWNNIMLLLKNKTFIGYSICLATMYGGILIWLSVGPILLQEELLLSPIIFGWIVCLQGAMYVVGGACNSHFVKRFKSLNIIKYGLYLVLLSGIFLLVSHLLNYFNVYVIVIGVVLFTISSSWVFINSFAGAIEPFTSISGTASSVCGFLQTLVGALTSTLFAMINNQDQLPMALGFITLAIIAFLSYKLLLSHAA